VKEHLEVTLKAIFASIALTGFMGILGDPKHASALLVMSIISLAVLVTLMGVAPSDD
jgi:hypothetical protein